MKSNMVEKPNWPKPSVAALLALLALLLASAPYAFQYFAVYKSQIHGNPIQVLPVQLISVPERYNGALVTMLGWCVIRFEQTTIQVSEHSSQWSDAIWLDLNDEQSATNGSVEPTFCRVRGTFQSGWSGHMGRWPGQINPVDDIILYEGLTATGEEIQDSHEIEQ
jgi:hypothetical protein